jgi:hypothetical protein
VRNGFAMLQDPRDDEERRGNAAERERETTAGE